MVYVEQNSQNFSGLFPSSGILKNTTFRKLDLFPKRRVFLEYRMMEKFQKHSANSVRHYSYIRFSCKRFRLQTFNLIILRTYVSLYVV
jgi:hypothetical protein